MVSRSADGRSAKGEVLNEGKGNIRPSRPFHRSDRPRNPCSRGPPLAKKTGQCQKQVVNLPDYGGYIRGMCSARTVVRVPCHGWIWADIVARKGLPPLAQVRTLSAAGPHFCPGPATVFGLLCILASPVPNKTTDLRRKSHRPGTMRYQTLLGMSIISKNNRVFALSRDSVASLRHLVRSRGAA